MDKKKLIILIACLAVVLVACIVVAVVMLGSDSGKLPENPTEPTEQSQPATEDTQEATEPGDTTAPTTTTEPSGTTEATEPSKSDSGVQALAAGQSGVRTAPGSAYFGSAPASADPPAWLP